MISPPWDSWPFPGGPANRPRPRPWDGGRPPGATRPHRPCPGAEPLARERGVRFEVRPPVEEQLQPTILEVDSDRLLQVVVNLVRNAVEASSQGQTVEIGWKNDRGRDGSTTTVWVQDQGQGIAAEDLEHIMEPFYSKKAGGTGLGLYVSHSVVEQHGGRLDVASSPGNGTRLTICLPSPAH